MFVQFSDANMENVCSVFSCPQNPNDYPNQAEIDFDDPRFVEYFEAQIPFIRDMLQTLAP